MSVTKYFLYWVTLLLYVATLDAGYANPGACSGSCNIHDPAVIKRSSDGKWFRFTSHNLIGIATASSISGPWTDVGSVLTGKSVISNSGASDPWAPDIQKYGNYYWCFYAVSTFGTQVSAIGVAVSSTMEPGTWIDKGAVFTSKAGDQYNAIDPNFIMCSNGQMYLSFGSFWQDIFLTNMKHPETTNGYPVNIAFNSTGTHAEEGSYIYYHEGYYYLFFSSGICCNYVGSMPAKGEEYRINVCRSKSVTGPYVDKSGRACTSGGGTTVLASHGKVYGPGGQGVYDNILYYHYVDTDNGYGDGTKLFGWNELKWSDGWPGVV